MQCKHKNDYQYTIINLRDKGEMIIMASRVAKYKCENCNVELKAYKMISFICPNCGEILWVNDEKYSKALNHEISKVKENDVNKMKNKTEKIKKYLDKKEFRGVKDLILKMIELLNDDNMKFSTKAIIVAAFAYLILPIDIIPDIVPVFGYLDDIAIIMIAAKLVSDIIENRVDLFQIKRKNNIKMGSIIYSLAVSTYILPVQKFQIF
jgi:uncharacterized membrane protein YkvA (DUF1232 family)